MKCHNKLIKTVSALVLCAVMLLGMNAPAAHAAGSGSITVSLAAEGVEYRLFRIGSVDRAAGKVVLVDGLKDVDISKPEAASKLISERILAWEKAGTWAPIAKAKVSGGVARFQGLEMGVYMLLGGTFMNGSGEKFTSLPSIVSLGSGQENAKVDGKFARFLRLSATKTWVGYTGAKHPTSVKVQLMCDGVKYGQAYTLSAANNWRVTWDNLEPTHVWSVIEVDSLPNYAVSCVTTLENGYIVYHFTNTLLITPPTLPKTGQLWWPVFAMSGTGILFLMLGFLFLRKRGEDA